MSFHKVALIWGLWYTVASGTYNLFLCFHFKYIFLQFWFQWNHLLLTRLPPVAGVCVQVAFQSRFVTVAAFPQHCAWRKKSRNAHKWLWERAFMGKKELSWEPTNRKRDTFITGCLPPVPRPPTAAKQTVHNSHSVLSTAPNSNNGCFLKTRGLGDAVSNEPVVCENSRSGNRKEPRSYWTCSYRLKALSFSFHVHTAHPLPPSAAVIIIAESRRFTGGEQLIGFHHNSVYSKPTIFSIEQFTS